MSDLARTSSSALTPARSLREVVRNCDPETPLRGDDPRWEDFSLARGDEATDALARELERRPAEQFVHAAFVSHRGAGKSTEILRLTDRLRGAYEAVYIEATIEMDPFQIEAEDLLLNLALAVEAAMRRRGTPLPDDLLERVQRWFEEVVSKTEWARGFSAEVAAGVEAKISAPFVGGLFGSLKALFKLETLVRIAHDKQIYPDQKCLDVLFHHLAFKYNGDGWYDVHPLVAELPEFERARREHGG
jgi:hypothetical protein